MTELKHIRFLITIYFIRDWLFPSIRQLSCNKFLDERLWRLFWAVLYTNSFAQS